MRRTSPSPTREYWRMPATVVRVSPQESAEVDRRPPSRRIADDLRRQIETGVYPPGEKLPSERVLAERYSAARNTAREAIRLLAEGGLVTAEHGRGVFVRPSSPLLRV